MTIVEFLRARLDEDEQIARAVADHRGRRGELSWQRVETEREPGLIGNALGGLVTFHGASQWQAEHIVRHDPGRVLREVEAKRRIVELHAEPHECPAWDVPLGETCTGYVSADECLTLRLEALPYADHSDYDPAWRP